jgi:hypothetical protein
MKKIGLLILISVITVAANAQIKFGPVVNLGVGFYSDNVDNLKFSSAINPSFGFAVEKYIDYWFSLRTSALYSFRNLKVEQKNDGLTDHLNGQFVDLFIDGIFSDFDDTKKISPYGTTGLGVGINIINKGQEKFLINNEYETALPFFSIGAGIRYKISFLSALDISLNYNRCLLQPINSLDARLNQMSLKVITLF